MHTTGFAWLARRLGLAAVVLFVALPAGAQGFPDAWFLTDDKGERFADHLALEGEAAPPLTVAGWVNGEVRPEQREGKIVVLDFWATWCQPCIAGIPHNNKLAADYAEDGVLFVAVCASGDPAQMPALLEAHGARYPSAFVEGGQVLLDWPLPRFPTYAVVDAAGTVRAVGLKRDAVEDVLDELLEEQARVTGRARIPRRWLEGDRAARERLHKLEDRAEAPPAIEAGSWVNAGEAGLTDADLEGKVVLLTFGATWAAPWLDAIDELNALHEAFADQGLVVVGVCATPEGFTLPDVAERYGLAFPAGVDIEGRTHGAFEPNGYPDYYLLDRNGHLRIADAHHDCLRAAVQALLAEQPDVPEGGAEDAKP